MAVAAVIPRTIGCFPLDLIVGGCIIYPTWFLVAIPFLVSGPKHVQVESDAVSFNCAMGAAAAASGWRRSLKLLCDMKRCEADHGLGR